MYSVTEAQSKLPQLLRKVAEQPIAITRHDRTVAYLLSKEQMEAITETLEVLANPQAIAAIREYEAGKTRFIPLSGLLSETE